MFNNLSNLNVKYGICTPLLLIPENKLVWVCPNGYNYMFIGENDFFNIEFIAGTSDDINKLKVIYEL